MQLKESLYGLEGLKRLGDDLQQLDDKLPQWSQAWEYGQSQIVNAEQAHLLVSTQETLPDMASAMVLHTKPSEQGAWLWKK